MEQPSSTTPWTRSDLLDPHQIPDKSCRVHQMFDTIACRYDLLNRLLSFNLDRRWRKTAARLANLEPGQAVLDLCCGTGDLAFAFLHHQPNLKSLTGLDFSDSMLQHAIRKSRLNPLSPQWLQGNAEKPPFPDNAFDRIGCAFGIRNLQNPKSCFHHLFRILKPVGRIVILEFALPRNLAFRWFYQFYFRLVLPVIAAIMVKDSFKAYKYLPESVVHYDTQRRLTTWMRETGFINIQVQRLSFGIVLAFTADKP